MTIDVVLLPRELPPGALAGKAVVVLDVLRATTTITSALAHGIRRIRAFASLEEAKSAAEATIPRPLTCGELRALRAPGMDLGNSPDQFLPEHAGREIFMATTNGTKALAASRQAAALFAGALVNASAVARAVANTGRDVVLLCSGTDGAVSMEDAIGAGAIANILISRQGGELATDLARIAQRLFLQAKDDLSAALHEGQGGHNLRRVNLQKDIEFAARLDVFDIVGVVDPQTLIISCTSCQPNPKA